MNKIRMIANQDANYVYHMLSVARCGYDNDYGAKYRGAYPAEDLAVLKRHERLITCSGGEHWGELYTLMLCYPIAMWQGDAKSFYLEIIRQADDGEVPEQYLSLAPAAREIAVVMAKHYDRYVRDIWPEDRQAIEAHISAAMPLFENSAFTDRAEALVGCTLPAECFRATMVASVEHGAEAIDISEDQDVFGISRRPEDSFLFIGHEFIIYLLKFALRETDAFRRFETWAMTEGLAEYYLKKLTGQFCFQGAQPYADFYEQCERERSFTAAELYRKALQTKSDR
ncbi:MAG: hypothetical protein IK127_00800 [Clostridia bacterium]|nr:hypothetical protein [Clostridia bacterium]